MPIDFPSSPVTGSTYAYGGQVWTYNGSAWTITTTNYVVGPSGPTGPTGPTGARGSTGTSFVWDSGGWTSMKIYNINNVVEYQGSSYIFYNDTDYAVPANPPPSLTAYWQLMAQRGATGATGSVGATGAAGGNTGGASMAFGVTGAWVRSPYTIQNVSLTTNGAQYLPIWIERGTTFDRISVRTVTVSTSGTIYLGIFNDHTSGGRPGTIKLNAGAVGFTASNTSYNITINQYLDRGWYWLASYITGGSSTWRGYGAYENVVPWYPRTFGDPGSGSPYDAFCPALFGGATWGDNQSTGYFGYNSVAIFLRTA